MPAAPLRAQLSDQDLTQRQQHRAAARRGLSDPAAAAQAIALAICEVEAGLRSASQLEQVCHHSLWQAIADRVQRTGGPPVSAASVLRVQVQATAPLWALTHRPHQPMVPSVGDERFAGSPWILLSSCGCPAS